MTDDPKEEATNSVAIEHIDGEWAIILREGEVVTQHMFVLESYARAFAEGQRIRLGLAQQNERRIPNE